MKKPNSSIIIALVLVLFLLMATSAITGCEPSIGIEIHNETDKTLNIYTGDTLIGSVKPGKELTWDTEPIYNAYQISAKDADGKTIYSDIISREEMERNKWRVVIPATAKRIEQSDNATGK